MLDLTGRTALITGAGSCGPGWGNGKAIAVLFARQGARVIAVDMDERAAAETASLILAEGGRCQVETCDVTDADAVAGLVARASNDDRTVDILVNNVGRSEPGGPAEMDPAVWDGQLAVNLTSAYLLCHHLLPAMERSGGGAVVNIASVAGQRYIGKPQVAYAAAKAGLIQFSKATAVLYAARNVRLNCVVPGLIATPLVSRLADKYADGDLAGFVATRNAQVPMGRMGDAWDVANAALFLASDEARYVTGTEIVVDGGFTAATR